MRFTRFRTRGLAVVCLVGAMLATACGGGGSSAGGESSGPVELRFSWWGNNDRAAITQKALDAFQAANPNIKVKGEFTDFNGYFDRLATQVAGGDAPDVITLGGAYPREYGDRGALLDLSTVGDVLKTDKLGEAALGNGNFNNVQYGVPTGVNAIGLVINPELFEKAGVELPDEDTWTWDDFKRIAKDLAKKLPKGSYAINDPTRTDTLDLFARQRGEGLYTPDGKVGISEQTLVDWWKMTLELRDAGATPPASMTAELITQPAPEQSLMGRGLSAMQFDWSNLLGQLRKASGADLRIIRAPGESAGKQPGLWLQASQLYTINARTEHPKEAAKLIDFLVNDPEAGKIILNDRGVSANSDVRAAVTPLLAKEDTGQVEYIDRLAPKAGPPLVIGPAGSADAWRISDRINGEVLFDRMRPEQGAAEFVKQVGQAIQQ
jgi:multiple sugar transport system substrate-binding protein